ncbi:hypothetical protein BRC62_00455 [Halobacteriales archaeon QH_10_67_13]|nr:MAG: hypothetical protein BRC62_00455 [Halobacteriales archaeon QH_10_67_13]
MFFTVALALTGSKQFFSNVKTQPRVERADRLRALPETYPALANRFGLVRTEVSSDRHNPVTGLDVTTGYHDEEEVPFVSYTLYSGETPLHEARGSPQEILQTARYLVQATNDFIDEARYPGRGPYWHGLHPHRR